MSRRPPWNQERLWTPWTMFIWEVSLFWEFCHHLLGFVVRSSCYSQSGIVHPPYVDNNIKYRMLYITEHTPWPDNPLPYQYGSSVHFRFPRGVINGAHQDASECNWIEIQPTISKAVWEYSNTSYILSTKALNVVVFSSFRGNIPSSGFNGPFYISGRHLGCLQKYLNGAPLFGRRIK